MTSSCGKEAIKAWPGVKSELISKQNPTVRVAQSVFFGGAGSAKTSWFPRFTDFGRICCWCGLFWKQKKLDVFGHCKFQVDEDHDNTTTRLLFDKKPVYHPPKWKDPIWADVITLVMQLTVVKRDTFSIAPTASTWSCLSSWDLSLPESTWVFRFFQPCSPFSIHRLCHLLFHLIINGCYY